MSGTRCRVISILVFAALAASCSGGLRLRGSSQLAFPDDPPETWALGCMVGPGAIPPSGEPAPDAPPLAQPDGTQAALMEVLVRMKQAERSAWSHHTDRVIERLEGEPQEVRQAWRGALKARLDEIKAEEDDPRALKAEDACFGALSELYEGVSFVATSRR